MEHTTRNHDTPTRSYVLGWKGNMPKVEESHWAPGYTEAHKATVDEAVKFGMNRLHKEVADAREKWININTLVAAMVDQDLDEGILPEGADHA